MKKSKLLIKVILVVFSISALNTTSSFALSKEVNVLALGDSITAGMDENNKWVGNYYSALNDILTKKNIKWSFLGDYSRDQKTQYQADGGFCLASIKYKCNTSPKNPNSITQLYLQFHKNHKEKLNYVFIQGGINDLSSRRNAPNSVPEPIVSLRSLIKQVKKDNPGVKIILLNLTKPVLSTEEVAFNKNISKLGKEYSQVYIIDTTSVKEKSLFIDGLHPNAAGYKALGLTLFNALHKLKFI